MKFKIQWHFSLLWLNRNETKLCCYDSVGMWTLIDDWRNCKTNVFWMTSPNFLKLGLRKAPLHSLKCLSNIVICSISTGRGDPKPYGPLLLPCLTLIPAVVGNHIPNKVWDEITYPFPNSSSVTVAVWKWISNFIPKFILDVTSAEIKV